VIDLSAITAGTIFKWLFGIEFTLTSVYVIYRTYVYTHKYGAAIDTEARTELWKRLAENEREIAKLRLEIKQAAERYEAEIVKLNSEKALLVVRNLEAIYEIRNYQIQIAAMDAALGLKR
jgi:glutamine synthetase type III